MDEELRERLAKALYEATWEDADWNAAGQVEQEWHRQSVAGLLAEIEAAGYALVQTGDGDFRVILTDIAGARAVVMLSPGEWSVSVTEEGGIQCWRADPVSGAMS